MFMDDSLQINPSQLTNTIDNQLNMFTMEHEDQYGDLMNELINIFNPAGKRNQGRTGRGEEEHGQSMQIIAPICLSICSRS